MHIEVYSGMIRSEIDAITEVDCVQQSGTVALSDDSKAVCKMFWTILNILVKMFVNVISVLHKTHENCVL